MMSAARFSTLSSLSGTSATPPVWARDALVDRIAKVTESETARPRRFFESVRQELGAEFESLGLARTSVVARLRGVSRPAFGEVVDEVLVRGHPHPTFEAGARLASRKSARRFEERLALARQSLMGIIRRQILLEQLASWVATHPAPAYALPPVLGSLLGQPLAGSSSEEPLPGVPGSQTPEPVVFPLSRLPEDEDLSPYLELAV